MSCRPSSSPTKQQGAALIVALLVFALATALMVGLQRDFTLQLQRGSNAFASEQGWAYLRGAEALAAVALRTDAELDAAKQEPRDDLTEVWAREATPYPLPDGGWLVGNLEDLQGRLNLNALVETGASGAGSGDGATDNESSSDSVASGEQEGASNVEGGAGAARFNAPQKQLIRLLQTFEEPVVSQSQAIAITEAISDYIDADDQRRLEGAEDEAYRNTNPNYRTANQPLASVSELRAVAGVTPEIYAALAPLVTVWPATGAPLNILTASPQLLRTLNADENLEPLSPTDADRLAGMLASGEVNDVETLLGDIAFAGGATGLQGYLGTRSQWFLLDASVQIAGREMRLYSVLQRDNARILSRFRSQGEL